MRQDGSTFLLSHASPLLLLAEEEANDDEDVEDEYEDEDEEGQEEDEDEDGQEEEDEEGDFGNEEGDDNEEMEELEENQFIVSVGSAHGIYSLSTGKTYCQDLVHTAENLIKSSHEPTIFCPMFSTNSDGKLSQLTFLSMEIN